MDSLYYEVRNVHWMLSIEQVVSEKNSFEKKGNVKYWNSKVQVKYFYEAGKKGVPPSLANYSIFRPIRCTSHDIRLLNRRRELI